MLTRPAFLPALLAPSTVRVGYLNLNGSDSSCNIASKEQRQRLMIGHLFTLTFSMLMLGS